jgi:uncharacterized protein
MERRNGLDWLAWTLTIVGGLNWGLVGLFQFDLVAAIFGGQDALLARIVYTLVGLSALYSIFSLSKVTTGAQERALP